MVPRTRSSTRASSSYNGNPAGSSGGTPAQTGTGAIPTSGGINSPSSSSLSSALSPLELLRHRLGDGVDLMDDRFYISALLETDGDIEAAADLIEQGGDFELIDESLMEGVAESDYEDMETLVEGLEAQPTDDEIAGNPGPWNPRPGDEPYMTGAQREAVGILEDIIYPHVVDEDVIIDHLRDNNWDVVAAHQQWEQDRAEIIRRNEGRPATQPSNNAMNFMMDSGTPFNDNIEQERRDAARVFRDAVNREHATETGSGALISISEAILWLLERNFNLTGAFQDFTSRASLQADLSPGFDHMREPTTDRSDQDERLAILATITQRVDLTALESLLEAYQWDLIKAIVAWYKAGVAPQRHPKDKNTNKATLGYNRRCDMEGTPRKMPTKQETAVADRVEKGWALEVKEYAAGGRQQKPTKPTPRGNSHLGAIIDEDLWPVRPGAPRPRKMHFESIWNGKYWQGTFQHAKYRWIDQNHSDFTKLDPKTQQAVLKKPVFDWYDQMHVEDLNKWRRQRRQRATSGKIREASQPYSQEESDYLYQLNKEFIEDLMKKTGRSRDECIKMDVPTKTKQEWTDKLNAKFVGTMPTPHKKPVQPRSMNSLMTQRTRDAKIKQDFKVGQITTLRKKDKTQTQTQTGTGSHDDDDEDEEMPDVEEEDPDATEDDGEDHGDDDDDGDDDDNDL